MAKSGFLKSPPGKGHYEEKAKEVLGWHTDFFPIVRMPSFLEVISGSDRHPMYLAGLLRKLRQEGVLRFEGQGDYVVSSALFPEFPINPVARNSAGENQILRFVSKRHADDYKAKFVSRMKIREESLQVRAVGQLQIPEKIDVADWKILRIKHGDYERGYAFPGDQVISVLKKRDLVSRRQQGNFSVFRRSNLEGNRKYFNLQHNGRYFFTDEQTAKAYAASFPLRASADVLQHETAGKDDKYFE